MLTTSPSGQRLAFLDVARGLAALLVVLSHGLQVCLSPGYAMWVNANLDIGRVGVLVFLLISGFIIPASLEHGGSNARFWLRRLFRLFPAYWLSIALGYGYLACGGAARLDFLSLEDGPAWLVNLTMLQGFLDYPHVWGVFWTLSIELVLYAACSLLFACGLLHRVGGVVFLAILVGCVAYGIGRPLLIGEPFVQDVLLSLYLAPLFGLLAQRYVSGRLSRKRFYALFALLFGMLVAVWVVNRNLFPLRTGHMGLKPTLLAYACFFLLLEMRGRAMPAAGCWLGRVSFSVYLFHPLVMLWLAPLGPTGWAYLPCLIALSLLLSAATYRLVEEPGILLGRLVERRLLPPPRQSTEGYSVPAKAA